MKKLFSLLTLLLLLCTSAWGATTKEVYFVKASENPGTQSEAFTGAPTDGGNLTATFTVDGVTYDVKRRTSNGTFSISFSLASGKTARLWAVHNQSARHFTLTGASSIDRVESNTGFSCSTSNAYADVFDITDARSYTLSNSDNIGLVCLILKIDDAAPKHSVSAVTSTGTDTYGTVSSASATVAEGETTVITAVPASGYKVTNWAVSGTGATISPSGASNSLTTTLTMGTANATVTVTFGAATTYTISYAPGSADGVTGSKADETKTADVAFTLPSTPVFSRTGYTQTGWATSDGGAKAYELGGSYTTNAAQTFYPYWSVNYSFAPTKTSGSLSANEIVATSIGGVMIAQPGTGTLKYSGTGIEFGSKSGVKVVITLKNNLKVGSVITATLYNNQTDKARGLLLKNSSDETKGTWTWQAESAESKEWSYTVVADDGLAGSNTFSLVRSNNSYLQSLTVTNIGAEYAEPVMLKENTWASFCPSFDVTVPAEGSSNVSVNYATFNSSTNVLTTHKLNASGDVKIKAGEGVLLKASAAGLKQFLATTGAEEIDGNVLGGTTERTLTSTLKGSETYLMALNVENTFVSYTGEYFPANKAYFAVTPAGSAPSGIRIVDEESNATSLSDIESTDEGVKFIQNGQLFIKKNGVVYDMLGIVVRK